MKKSLLFLPFLLLLVGAFISCEEAVSYTHLTLPTT